MEEIVKKLEKSGFNKKESSIYLAALTKTQGTVTDIARSSGLKRTTVYQHLDRLIASGFVYRTISNKRVLYGANDPGKIMSIFERKKSEIDEERRRFERIVPELAAIYSRSHKKPGIEFYEGKSGLKKVYEKILRTPRNVYAIFSYDSFFRFFSHDENEELLSILYGSGGMLYNLVSESPGLKGHIREHKAVRYRFLPKGFRYETDLLVSGSTLSLISFKNMVGIIIEDEAIARLQENMFKLLWKSKWS